MKADKLKWFYEKWYYDHYQKIELDGKTKPFFLDPKYGGDNFSCKAYRYFQAKV